MSTLLKPSYLRNIFFTLTIGSLLSGSVGAQPLGASKLRLVVVFSIDQFRADYLNRFANFYLPAKSGSTLGGFNYLKLYAANYVDAHHAHLPTATGPGHATILTGSDAALNGIVGNDWYDRVTGKQVYCVEDAASKTVGGESAPMSPKNLLVTTIGDELKMATNGKAKVVGIALKDRASILMAGHAADTVIWFDGGNGGWVTSSFYAPNMKLPNWVQTLNSKGIPEKGLQETWTPLLKDEDYGAARRAPFVKGQPASPVFSHALAATNPRDKFRNWTSSPSAQKFVFDTVKTAIDAEGLGKDEVPDILAINLSSNDYIGHTFGPNSPEVLDISVSTDRMLSDLFNFLNNSVEGGMRNVVVCLTADHGVLPIVEEATEAYRLPSMRIKADDVINKVEGALSSKFGTGKWVLSFNEPHLYLDRALIASKDLKNEDCESVAAEAARDVPGIGFAFTRTQVMNGWLPKWNWAQMATNSFYAGRSGDVLVLESPGTYFGGGTGTGHGSAWAYDSHVPLLISGGIIKAGTFARTVSVADLAPTLSQILGIEQPSGNMGRPLHEALEKR